MVTLDIERINRHSPYPVMESAKNGFVNFVTDAGIVYSVGFEFTELIMVTESYQFVITNVNNLKSPRDLKLRNTILAIVREFFEANNFAMLYLCDTADDKQQYRHRLFRYWSTMFPEHDYFTVLSTRMRDEEGIDNYVTLTFRNDHPKAEEITAEFMKTVKLLGAKPNR